MVRFCISVLCLIVLCMKVTANSAFYFPEYICKPFCKARVSYEFYYKNNFYSPSFQVEHSSSETIGLMNDCLVLPTYNDDSNVNCICWGMYEINVGNNTRYANLAVKNWNLAVGIVGNEVMCLLRIKRKNLVKLSPILQRQSKTS